MKPLRTRLQEARRRLGIPWEVLERDYLYSIEEVVAEKLRSILQHVAILERRGWARSRARDYYDLWRVILAYKDRMVLTGFDSLLREKCAVREVSFEGPEGFFDDRMLAYVEETWEQSLGPLVPGLPSFETVADALRPEVAALVRSDDKR